MRWQIHTYRYKLFIPVSVIMMITANMSGYSASTPGTFIDMFSLQNCSMRFPTSSSKVALQARDTLEVPGMRWDQLTQIFCSSSALWLKCKILHVYQWCRRGSGSIRWWRPIVLQQSHKSKDKLILSWGHGRRTLHNRVRPTQKLRLLSRRTAQ